MAKVGVVAIVEHNNKILVGKKIKDKNHFLSEAWHIPGGKPEKNETEEQALIREMQEEAGIKIEVKKLMAENFIEKANIAVKWYLCKALTTDLKPGDDLADAKFVSKSEMFDVCHPAAINNWPQEVIDFFKN